MRMVRWMCGVGVKDEVPGGELRQGLGMGGVVLILQQERLGWCGHVLQKGHWLGEGMCGVCGGWLRTGRWTGAGAWREVMQGD